MISAGTGRTALVLASALFLGACAEGTQTGLFDKPLFQKKNPADGAQEVAPTAAGATVIERDVEAPDVFQSTEAGLWDGRPSLGGVWVAHPEVADPERVIIRNETNGNFVIGALFRRERENPGPRFQVSSDAATSLGLLAGAPAELSVTALRREEVPVIPDVTEPAPEMAEPTTVAEGLIEETTLDPIASVAASAIAAAEIEAASAGTSVAHEDAQAVAAAAKVSATAPVQKSNLEKPFVQIGIFSVQGNADRTADMLRKDGIIPVIKPGSTSGKSFWRVIVGPAASNSERTSLINKVRALGFSDAYAVSN